MARPSFVERRMSKFVSAPVTVRNAARIIVTGTAIVVLVSGVVMRLVDHKEYPNVWRAFWWAMQTVTTVGYGDVTPEDVNGRIVGVFVMLWGIAFLAILTAGITSTFIARAQRERVRTVAEGATDAEGTIEGRLAELSERLDRIERLLSTPGRE
ncbi:MAG TPA: potassium channel family protein [Gaiellaceae bacterium]|nr:potassium channel family protein [Gaiellaceae bacterium]